MKCLSLMLFLFSAQVFAHPNDGDSIFEIPVNSKLVVQEDINFKPNSSGVVLSTISDRIPYFPENLNRDRNQCFIRTVNISKDDRALWKDDVVLNINDIRRLDQTLGFLSGEVARFYVDHEGVEYIECYRTAIKVHSNGPAGPKRVLEHIQSIGDLREIFGDKIELQIAPPKSL